ncbi:hypothetical protein [Microbulbifer sp. TYP-18]|uniref:hypothetical protein n=1 Tax=Microbulbifer sp. TYP-18 TaxID=3230024 RepID=UPI0034C66AB3
MTGDIGLAFQNGIIAGISAAAFSALPGGWSPTNIAVRGVTGGILAKLSGGKFAHGFISAGVGGGFGQDTHIVTLMLVSGMISEATGGKFAHGAATVAFTAIIKKVIVGGLSKLARNTGIVGSELEGLSEEQKQKNFDKNLASFEKALSVIDEVSDLEVPSFTVVDSSELNGNVAGISCGLFGCDENILVSKQYLQTGRSAIDFLRTAYHEVLHFNDPRYINAHTSFLQKFGVMSSRHEEIYTLDRQLEHGGLRGTLERDIYNAFTNE